MASVLAVHVNLLLGAVHFLERHGGGLALTGFEITVGVAAVLFLVLVMVRPNLF
ncbi:MAG: hypothetical protein LBI33_00440 [Propionibacteriaceae bacterium]|nr:hypothetical protein [Propionibacteriaceae bacterium]